MSEFKPNIGLDVGTSFLQVAKERMEDESVQIVAERDAFYALTPETKIQAKFVERGLKQKEAFVLKSGKTFFVVGQKAIEVALERGDNVERPLKRGVLSRDNLNSMGMLAMLIESLVGKATSPNAVCVYSYPADPIDETFEVTYHQNRIGEILGNLGYKAEPLLEAEALAYSELDDDLTGITMSCGAGMHNLAVFHMGQNILSFSIAKGGDYIDKGVATSLDISETAVQATKEDNLDLMNPVGEIQEAIVMYYKKLIKYIIEVLESKFSKKKEIPHFAAPILFVVSGGTSMPKGYIDLVKEELFRQEHEDPEDPSSPLVPVHKFPFEVSEVRHASDPLTAVANGCLIYAQMFEE